ncbi:MAG: hypothetical protein JOY94_14075 [Methylobacteriaceae bacterium]|nr:hypothetical protein [Methylobacteriaceae bacterium]
MTPLDSPALPAAVVAGRRATASSSLTSGLRLVALAIVGFAVAAWGMREVLRRTGLDDRNPLIVQAQVASAFKSTNLLFLGTSRVEQGINPDEFDRAMAARGHQIHSFNLGLAGASLIEVMILTRNYLEANPCCVRYVVLEPDFAQLSVIEQPNSARAIEFFDLSNSIELMRYMNLFGIRAGIPLTPKYYFRGLAISLLRHYSNLGLAHLLLDPSQLNYRLWPSTRGYSGYDRSFADRLASDEKAERAYDHTLARLSRLSDVREGGFSAADRSDPVTAAALRGLVGANHLKLLASFMDFIRSRGASVIILRMPMTAHWNFETSFVARYRSGCADGPPLLDFGDPKEAATFFAPENRTDADHLNIRGATLFSRILAERIDDLLNSGAASIRPAPACGGG